MLSIFRSPAIELPHCLVSEVKLSDPWRRFEQHKQILTSHEERLEKNATKIEIIKEMLDDIQGTVLNNLFSTSIFFVC